MIVELLSYVLGIACLVVFAYEVNKRTKVTKP